MRGEWLSEEQNLPEGWHPVQGVKEVDTDDENGSLRAVFRAEKLTSSAAGSRC
jgi:hypothetical protein